LYAAIKKKLEENKEKWQLPRTKIKCDSCGTEDSVAVNLDQSNFFVTA
jgi:hypothetical protein